MKRLVVILVVIAVVVIVFLILGPFYVVEEGEQAVVVRFGEVRSTTDEAGLHLKTPIVDTIIKYPKRIMSWDGQPRLFPTEEQQFIFVDTTARWQIVNPQLFYERLTTVESAYGRLDDVIESAVATIIAQNPIYEAVRTTNIINEMLTSLASSDPAYPKIVRAHEQIQRMNDITHKIGNIKKYEAVDYVAGVKIVDIDKAS